MSKKQNSIAFSVVAVILLASAIALGYGYFSSSEQLVAVLSVEGHPNRIIKLQDANDQVIDLHEEYDVNILLEIKDHKIHFLQSDCPDKICIHSGYLSKDLDMAACIPNRTAVFIQKED